MMTQTAGGLAVDSLLQGATDEDLVKQALLSSSELLNARHIRPKRSIGRRYMSQTCSVRGPWTIRAETRSAPDCEERRQYTNDVITASIVKPTRSRDSASKDCQA